MKKSTNLIFSKNAFFSAIICIAILSPNIIPVYADELAVVSEEIKEEVVTPTEVQTTTEVQSDAATGNENIAGISNEEANLETEKSIADEENSTVYTSNSVVSVPVNCVDGFSMTYGEFVIARDKGLVSYQLTTDTTLGEAKVVINNSTGCTIPMSLSSYKMFDGKNLSTQEYFSGTGEIQATSSTVLIVPIPSCLSQVDFWYGDAPKVLVDNYDYGSLPVPVVLTWALPHMTGVSPDGSIEGPLCTKTPPPAPVCTLGENLIKNGGFENPKLSIPWGSVHINDPELMWTSYDTVTYPYVEIQAGYTELGGDWSAHGGVQYAEIDGGTNHDVSQVINTIPGKEYTISYWASPRPNQSTAVNIMNISFGGQLMDTYIGAGSINTEWTKRSYVFTATTTSTRLSFTQGQNTAIGEGVFLDDVSVTCGSSVVPPPPPPPAPACEFISDTSTLVGDKNAVLTYDQNPYWTASIPGAKWIWSNFKVVDPGATTTVVFTKTFNATTTPTQAILNIAADNSYSVKINGNVVGGSVDEYNFTSATQDTYDVTSAISLGANTMVVEVTNWARPGHSPEQNPAGLLYKLSLNGHNCDFNPPRLNTPPIITLVGPNPATTTVGQVYVDQGATAADTEDGNLTSQIVVTGTVNASTTGTYTLTYVVKDSGNLYATTTRTVIVEATSTPPVIPPTNPPGGGGGGNGGGGSSLSGSRRHTIVAGEILGATSCFYLRDFLKIDWQNDKIEVLKLQSFLNVFEKENLSLTGVFDQTTFEAVQRFQMKYREDILAPWGEKVTTGFVYILTKKKVNEIYCNSIFPISSLEQNEIDNFRNSPSYGSGVVGGNSGYNNNGSIKKIDSLKDVLSGSDLVVELKDNSSSTSVVRNLAVSLFALPQRIFKDIECASLFWIILALLIVIGILLRKLAKKNTKVLPNDFATPSEPTVIFMPPASTTLADVSNEIPSEEIIIENEDEEVLEDDEERDLRN